MALVIADRVRETTSSVGTGAVTLTGAFLGFQPFSVIGNGNTTYYAIIDAAAGTWEVGVGTYTSSGNTLSRDTVLDSSNAGAPVNFASGLKDVICTQPAERAVLLDSATNATIPGITLSGGTANGVAYLNGSKVLTTGSGLVFDGNNLGLGNASPGGSATARQFSMAGSVSSQITQSNGTAVVNFGINASNLSYLEVPSNNPFAFFTGGTEQMRLTSTGLGIGTSSPDAGSGAKLTTRGIYVDTGGGDAGYGWQIVSTTSGAAPLQLIAPAITFSTGANLARSVKATLDTSGNLGLGVTPSAWRSTTKALQGTAGSIYDFSTSGKGITQNAYLREAPNAWTYINDGPATQYDTGSGTHAWFTAPSGTAGNAISFTQAMTLDASGRLGVGATSLYSQFTVKRDIDSADVGDSPSIILSNRNYGTSGRIAGGVFANVYRDIQDNAISAGVWFTRNNFAGVACSSDIVFGAASNFGEGVALPTERARITSAGDLLVGTTSGLARLDVRRGDAGTVSFMWKNDTSANAVLALRQERSTGATSGAQIEFGVASGVVVGSITSTGSATSYNTSSDYRLKENIQPMTGALAKVAQLKPCTYKWKADGSDGEGFIAHELAEVVPDCVTGEKDAVDAEGNPVYQGIDTSFLVATLTAAIQEQQAIITAQAAQIQQLREKVLEVEEGTSNMLVENTNNLYETITALTARVAALEAT